MQLGRQQRQAGRRRLERGEGERLVGGGKREHVTRPQIGPYVVTHADEVTLPSRSILAASDWYALTRPGCPPMTRSLKRSSTWRSASRSTGRPLRSKCPSAVNTTAISRSSSPSDDRQV